MPVASDVILGGRVKIFHPALVNLYGCRIGDDTKIGTFIEAMIGAGAVVTHHVPPDETVAGVPAHRLGPHASS